MISLIFVVTVPVDKSVLRNNGLEWLGWELQIQMDGFYLVNVIVAL